jgi:ATP-dependent Clp protease ATP-binding subunit ClpA
VRLIEELAEQPEVVIFLRDLDEAYGFDLEDHLQVLLWRLPGALLAEGEAAGVRSLLEYEPQLERRLSLVEVAEPTVGETRGMLAAWARWHRESGGARFEPAALDAALELSSRFLVRSRLPRKAIEPLGQLAVAHRSGGTVTEAEVVRLYCRQYGLPRTLVDPEAPLDLRRLGGSISRRLLGQPEAVEAVVEMIGRVKAGLLDPRRPLGAFLLVGPCGVGKTHLARLLAEELLGAPERLIRLNMAEYARDEDAGAVFGWPRAQSRHERRGQLAERIYGCQFGVMLLDEFEKAAPQVHDGFLQLLDEGAFINGAGESVPCRSLVIFATSNAGAELWLEAAPGFRAAGGEAGSSEEVAAALRGRFRFELLNRFDRVIVFRPLGEAEVRALVAHEVGALERRSGLARHRLRIALEESAMERVLAEGHHPRHGVRFLRQTVERLVTTEVARLLVARRPAAGSVLVVRDAGGRLAVEVAPPAAEDLPAAAAVEDPRERLALAAGGEPTV